jgi:hypothetical protein
MSQRIELYRTEQSVDSRTNLCRFLSVRGAQDVPVRTALLPLIRVYALTKAQGVSRGLLRAL